MKKTSEIRIRDPFILPDTESRQYYLYASTALNNPDTMGFDCYRSADLVNWSGPFPVFRPAKDFWGTKDFWAPEVHFYQGRYYLFASFKASKHYRATQIMVADSAGGPFVPISDGPVTPENWGCLDGTLHIDAAGNPWIVFCREWVQVHNGSMWAMPLTADLSSAAGRPVYLFSASEAPWKDEKVWPDEDAPIRYPTFVTDGPFMYRTKEGVLLMIWSSFGEGGYTLGIVRSAGGEMEGPWVQDETPLYRDNGGHAMIFRTFDGALCLCLHAPNTKVQERLKIFEIEDTGQSLNITGALFV